MTKLHHYAIALAIIIASVIYVFGNRYTPITNDLFMGTLDRFTGKVYSSGGFLSSQKTVFDLIAGESANLKPETP